MLNIRNKIVPGCDNNIDNFHPVRFNKFKKETLN